MKSRAGLCSPRFVPVGLAGLGLLASTLAVAQVQDPQATEQPQIIVHAKRPVQIETRDLGRRAPDGAPVQLVTLKRTVSYADLDLTSTKGAEKLRDRVRAAATASCQQLETLYPVGDSTVPGETQTNQDCIRNAIDSAMPGADAAIAAARNTENDNRVALARADQDQAARAQADRDADARAQADRDEAARADAARAEIAQADAARAEAAREAARVAAARAEAAQADAARAAAERSELQAALQQEQQQNATLRAEQTERAMVFTLGGSLLFTSGSTDLQPGALMTLQNVAQIMQKYPNLRVRVEGFTDSRGSDALNDALSRDRAAAVAQALQNDGVDPSRLEVIGHGKSMPVATNSSAVGRQFNRRVALVFSGFGGPSQTASTQPPEQLR